MDSITAPVQPVQPAQCERCDSTDSIRTDSDSGLFLCRGCRGDEEGITVRDHYRGVALQGLIDRHYMSGTPLDELMDLAQKIGDQMVDHRGELASKIFEEKPGDKASFFIGIVSSAIAKLPEEFLILPEHLPGKVAGLVERVKELEAERDALAKQKEIDWRKTPEYASAIRAIESLQSLLTRGHNFDWDVAVRALTRVQAGIKADALAQCVPAESVEAVKETCRRVERVLEKHISMVPDWLDKQWKDEDHTRPEHQYRSILIETVEALGDDFGILPEDLPETIRKLKAGDYDKRARHSCVQALMKAEAAIRDHAAQLPVGDREAYSAYGDAQKIIKKLRQSLDWKIQPGEEIRPDAM